MKSSMILVDDPGPGLRQHECRHGHRALGTIESFEAGRTCAHCDNYDIERVLETIKTNGFKPGGKPYKSGGKTMLVLLDEAGRARPFSVCDLSNGLYPGLELADSVGMYLYYMRVKGLWKIGVSRNPYNRLADLNPTILWKQWYTSEASARLEEARIKARFKEYRNRDRNALDGRGGWTEMFTKDVLGLDNV